jgi:hypothetical protein
MDASFLRFVPESYKRLCQPVIASQTRRIVSKISPVRYPLGGREFVDNEENRRDQKPAPEASSTLCAFKSRVSQQF